MTHFSLLSAVQILLVPSKFADMILADLDRFPRETSTIHVGK